MLRKWITLMLAAGLLTGCIAEDERENEKVLCEFTHTIAKEDYVSCSFTLFKIQKIHVEATLISGPAVELKVMKNADFSNYKRVLDGAIQSVSYRYYPELSADKLEGNFKSGWYGLMPGSYELVIENTSVGAVKPPVDESGAAWIRYKVKSRE